jgi:tetratricopeptide (TPR) repeat protein
MRNILYCAAGAALIGAAAGRAETLPVEGVYAAETDAPSLAETIAIAGFGGRGGERVAFAIDSALRAARIEGRPWFQITFSDPAFGENYRYDREADPAARRGGVDAVMRGIAEVEWRDVDSGTKQVEECVTKDDRGKCTGKKKVDVPCRARNLQLRAEVRMVARGGDLLYARSDTLPLSRRFCKDEGGPPSVDSMIEELAGQFAASVRRDVAPMFRAEEIRVLESRSGMPKTDHAAFREALRLTKSDVAAACAAFAALEPTNPRSITVLFNIGLCHESAGDLEAAEQAYQTVLTIAPRKVEPIEGLARIASRRRAERQMALREAAGAEAR